MDAKSLKKLSYIVNSVLLGIVIGLLFFFKAIEADILFWFSIPTTLIYLLNYYLLHRDMLDQFVWIVFFWITLYMGLTTLCLGYAFGFHLYCFSVIPIIFFTEYMSYRLETKQRFKALYVCIGMAVFSMICSGYVVYFGPIYQRDQKTAAFFWIFNGITVFCFLIYYTNFLIRSIIASEEKLRLTAHIDRLTGLYNRHYMLERLDSLPEDGTAGTLAIADIDDFKQINDRYGHNAGDLVLETVSDIMRRECPGCDIARWGGEEFLILIPTEVPGAEELPERMRKAVEASPVEFDRQGIKVTVTVGAAERQPGHSIDEWIQLVDEKLYTGKKSGKNRVIR